MQHQEKGPRIGIAQQSRTQRRTAGYTAEAQDVRKNPWQLTAVVYIGA
jgi:hypothetical protein